MTLDPLLTPEVINRARRIGQGSNEVYKINPLKFFMSLKRPSNFVMTQMAKMGIPNEKTFISQHGASFSKTLAGLPERIIPLGEALFISSKLILKGVISE